MIDDYGDHIPWLALAVGDSTGKIGEGFFESVKVVPCARFNNPSFRWCGEVI